MLDAARRLLDGIALHNARACMVRNNAVLASRHRQFFSTEDGLAKKLNQLELLLDGGFARPAGAWRSKPEGA